jgi:hypothetical protein
MRLRGLRNCVSRLVPNSPLGNRLIALPLFRRHIGRWPLRPECDGADFNDFVFERMVRNGWSDLERRCTDKELAKAEAKRLCPGVRISETVEVFRVSAPDAQARLTGCAGRSLVAKPTHSAGFVLWMSERPSPAETVRFLAGAAGDHFLKYRESQYAGLEKKILLEEQLPGGIGDRDYKVSCAWGEPFCCEVVTGRRTHKQISFFSVPDFVLQQGGVAGCPRGSCGPPANLELILACCRELSQPFSFVRVDVYSDGTDVWFGEFTFTPGGAMEPFEGSVGRWLLEEYSARCGGRRA